MRHSRAFSFSCLAQYEVLNDWHFKHSPDKPVHRPTQSLLITTSGFNNFRGLLNWGAFLLFITTSRMALENVIKYGIVVDPTTWLRFLLQTRDKYFAFGLLLCCNVFILKAWLVECAIVRSLIGAHLSLVLSFWNLFSVLAFPTVAIWYHEFNPLFSAPVLMVYTVLFLKLWSYTAVNRWCRKASARQKTCCKTEDILNLILEQHRADDAGQKTMSDSFPSTPVSVHESSSSPISDPSTDSNIVRLRKHVFSEDEGVPNEPCSKSTLPENASDSSRVQNHVYTSTEYRTLLDALELEPHGLVPSLKCNEIGLHHYVFYPDNIALGNLYYFIFAPTLCYELNFPRTLAIRKVFVLKRLFEVIFLTQLIFCLIQQWVLLTLKNSVAPISESNFSQFAERCLKLAIPNHLIWLLFFYSTFHSFLNLVGELMRFGDRFFYSDWWNAESVQAFWSKWNIPVHRFARRHIYLPLIECGLTRPQAGIVVFFISAVLHEFLISVPLKMPRMWAFLCMFGQIPYAAVVNWLFPKGGPWCNLAVWITLIIGQPMAMLFYFHDYYLAHYIK